MKFEDQVLALFGEANPVPGEATVDDLARPRLEVIEHRSEQMADIKVRKIDTERPIVKLARRRGPLVGVAAVVIALLIGTVGWIALAGSSAPTLEEAAEAGDAIAVIEVFHQEWTDGDVDGALAFVDQSVLEGAETTLRNLMEFVVALEPEGWFWSVTGCAEQAPGAYRCRVELIGDPVIDALTLTTESVQFRVEDNRLSELGFANYRAEDQVLSSFARQKDPAAYESVCTEPTEGQAANAGVVYGPTCGAFLSQFVEGLAAELTAP